MKNAFLISSISFSKERSKVEPICIKNIGIKSPYPKLESLLSRSCFREKNVDIKEEDSLLDISSDNTPSVAKVTMGDAEEYYSDLGLEYNIDYKDVSHEKATGRRTDLKNFDEEEIKKDDTSIEENLFDLIDSMYDEKKGE